VIIGALTMIQVVLRQGSAVVQRTEAAQRGRLALEPDEGLPDPIPVGGGDPGPLVLHLHPDQAPGGPDPEEHPAVRRPVPEGVVQQIDHHLVQAVGVHRGADRFVELGAEPHRRGAGQGREPLHDLADQRRQRPPDRPDPGTVPLRPGEPEHVLHQVGEPAGLLDDDPERLTPLVLPGHPPELQGLGEEEDLGERGAELVGHAGGEVGPEPRQLLLPVELA
jgi:hypothetical protein